MEIVNIKRLKVTLRQGELPARETAKYLAAQGAILSLILVPAPAGAPVDWAFVAHPLLALGGVYYCYRQNGGESGKRFAERYLAIGWVIGWRIGLMLASAMVVSFGLSLLARGNIDWLESKRAAEAITTGLLVVVAFIYWRMGHHMADLHHGRALPDAGSLPVSAASAAAADERR